MKASKAFKAFYTADGAAVGSSASFLSFYPIDHEETINAAKKRLLLANGATLLLRGGLTLEIRETDFGDADQNQLSWL